MRSGAIVLIVAILVVSGVGFYYVQSSGHGQESSTGPIKVTDSLNRTFYFQSPVTRIVSIDPAATATLYALGAYKDLVGGNEFDSYPPSESIPNVGDSYSINYQMLVNLTPQVVLVYGSTFSSVDQKINNTLNIPVIVDNPNSISQIMSFTSMLGNLTGTEHNATLINNWVRQSVTILRDSVPSVNQSSEESVFYYLSNYGGIWTMGQNTFINQMFQIAKLRNIVSFSGSGTINAEVIVNQSPDILLLDQYVPVSAANVAPFNETAAYYSSPQRIYTIFNDSFFDEPDFRIVYSIYWLISTMYPSSMPSLPQFPIKLAYPPTTGFSY